MHLLNQSGVKSAKFNAKGGIAQVSFTPLPPPLYPTNNNMARIILKSSFDENHLSYNHSEKIEEDKYPSDQCRTN